MGKGCLGDLEDEIELDPKFLCTYLLHSQQKKFLCGVVGSRSREKRSSVHLEQYREKGRFTSYVCKGGDLKESCLARICDDFSFGFRDVNGPERII